MPIRRKNHRGGRRRTALFAFVLLFIFVVAIAVLVRRTMYIVKDIQVTGNAQYTAEDAVALSGIKLGQSIFQVSEDSVRKGFARHGVLSFEGMEVEMPSTVRIFVRERVPRVVTNYAGLPTQLDEYGYAVAQSRELPDDINLPTVTGLRLTSCEVGRQAVSDTPYQIESMSEVITQIYALQINQTISELNVSDLDNLYLMTRSGMMVKLGDMDNMQNKMLWMQGALAQLTSEGAVKGVLDVSSAQSAVYQPTVTQAPTNVAEPVIGDLPAADDVGA